MAYQDDEYSNDTKTTGVVPIGGSAIGNLDYLYDADWFKTTLTAGTTYVFSLLGARNPLDISDVGTMYLSIGDGTTPLAGAGGRKYISGPAFEFTPTRSGDYYLDVGYSIGPYKVTAAIKPPDAISADIHTTAVLTAGSSVQGSCEVAGDTDWYRFHAEPGQHYAFSWSRDDIATSSIAIYDINGKPVDSYPVETAVATDYFIAISGNLAGEYHLNSLLRTDDYTANGVQPGLLQVGAEVSGKIEYAGDTDRFNLDLKAGSTYTVTLKGVNNSYGLVLKLYDTAGNLVDSVGADTSTTNTRELTFIAKSSGTYAVKVSDLYADQTYQRSYTLAASGGTLDDYGDTAATATAIALNTPVRGVSAFANDIDMFKLTLKAGVTYELQLSPDTSSSANASAWLKIQGPNIATSLNWQYGTTPFTPSADGDYYITINSASSTPASYLLNATLAKDDFGANTTSAGNLTLNGTTLGTLESYADRDWFALNMTAGQTYGVILQRPSGYNNSGLGYYSATVKIVDAQGNTLASTTSEYSSAPLLSYTTATSGKFYVEIGTSGGAYSLGATLVQSDDVGNTPVSAAVMPAGATVNGALEVSSDIDYYKMSVTAGETYAIELKDVVPNDSWRLSLDVTDKQGAYVRSNGDTTLITATSSGDIYFKISGQSGAPVLAYQLIGTKFGADDYGAGLASTTIGALAVGGSVRGVINYVDDSDWFKVSLQEGVTYQFDVQGAAKSNGSSAVYDAPLMLFDSKHNLMTTSNAIRASTTLGYTVKSSGDYYVQVQNKGSSTTFTDSYVLSAQAIPAKPQLLTSTSGEAGLHQLTDKIVLNFNEALRLIGDNKIKLVDEAGNTYSISQYKISAGFNTTLVLPLPIPHLKPGMTYKLSIESGALVNAAGVAFDGLQNYTITTTPFAAGGSSGDDLLLGQHNGATLHGGAGIDTVVYSDADSFFRVTRNGNQAVVNYQFGATTSDTLVDVERLLFNTKAIALDIDGNGGQAYRLYQAAFGRTPDQAGLGYWIKALDQGSSLKQVASQFVASAEFIARNGGAAVDDAGFVTLLYNNVLHRAPDVAGQQYWFDALHNNATRAEVLVSFSESAENQAALIGVIGNGFEYTPYGG
ncbi:DUF4214 domain-containing protein [Pseudoduganella sp. FT55W]|uniref:DUF4214 domain-containing protein n=1 Tax=Duganella rivi TaxID=2666083 RepID=A0A7X4GW59_9BURK|nr:DUF4214 domain-containing protein [Duganella rivi]MYM70246.1 DUF4214 domain-containing protein [Duganella rivi]